MRQIQKLISFTFLVTLLLGLMVTTYGQNPPQHFEDSFTIEGICSFPVLVELSGKAKTIELTGGKSISNAPGEVARFTNLDDPTKQEVIGITGAFHQSVLANGDMEFVVTGRNLLIGFDPDALFVVTVGNFSFVFDENFNLVQPVTGTGQVIDVCGLLE
ncbi:MAG TPA: hypothetical protein VF074_08910 [Pyrinomonadaceae bacterium]